MVSITNCDMISNEATLSVVDIATSSSGGGVFVAFLANEMLSRDNEITISSSRFISNDAGYGGGFSIEVQNEQNTLSVDPTNKLTFDNCTFNSNSAYQGSSAFFYQDNNKHSLLVNTIITNTTFRDGHCSINSITSQFTLPCSGNVYLYEFDIIFNDTIVLRDNGLSGLTMSSSHVELLPGTQLYLINNTALKGAGLHLVDCSAVIVSNNSTIYFDSNNAVSKVWSYLC